MKDKSIWLDGISRKKFNKLGKDTDCDILIIGSGITGISCAYFLKDSNKKIILVDRNKLCTSTTAKSTTTKSTAAKATSATKATAATKSTTTKSTTKKVESK